ncbi:MAG: hypothetical protein JSV75_03485, partial [Candidatus Bathyarchaeota archaeon]
MKLSTLFALSILLCIFVASFSVISPVNAAPYLTISQPKTTGHAIDDGHYAVYGEIRNIGDQPATSISFIVDFRDMWAVGGDTGASVDVVGVELNSPIVLHPGESWPWEAHFIDERAIEVNNHNIEPEINYVATDALPTGL